jgi:hypothetical protein
MTRFALAVLAYAVPTFVVGYVWHLHAFKAFYEALQIYREDIIIPFGVASTLIQGVIWALIYSRLFAGEPVARGAAKFAILAFPLAWSFLVLVIAAKHPMASVSRFLAIETGFTLLQYVGASPLLALAFTSQRKAQP